MPPIGVRAVPDTFVTFYEPRRTLLTLTCDAAAQQTLAAPFAVGACPVRTAAHTRTSAVWLVIANIVHPTAPFPAFLLLGPLPCLGARQTHRLNARPRQAEPLLGSRAVMRRRLLAAADGNKGRRLALVARVASALPASRLVRPRLRVAGRRVLKHAKRPPPTRRLQARQAVARRRRREKHGGNITFGRRPPQTKAA